VEREGGGERMRTLGDGKWERVYVGNGERKRGEASEDKSEATSFGGQHRCKQLALRRGENVRRAERVGCTKKRKIGEANIEGGRKG